jgi:putative membrane protein
MRAVKTVFWIVVAIALIAVAYANPKTADVQIWPGLIWEPPTWALVIGALAIGFFPTWLILSTHRWRLARRITSLEASLAVHSHTINTHADPVVVPDEIR